MSRTQHYVVGRAYHTDYELITLKHHDSSSPANYNIPVGVMFHSNPLCNCLGKATHCAIRSHVVRAHQCTNNDSDRRGLFLGCHCRVTMPFGETISLYNARIGSLRNAPKLIFNYFTSDEPTSQQFEGATPIYTFDNNHQIYQAPAKCNLIPTRTET